MVKRGILISWSSILTNKMVVGGNLVFHAEKRSLTYDEITRLNLYDSAKSVRDALASATKTAIGGGTEVSVFRGSTSSKPVQRLVGLNGLYH
jgi:hypothetical protein